MRDPLRLDKKHQPEKGVWHNKGDEKFTSPTKAAAQKKYGTTSQGMMPWILSRIAGSGRWRSCYAVPRKRRCNGHNARATHR